MVGSKGFSGSTRVCPWYATGMPVSRPVLTMAVDFAPQEDGRQLGETSSPGQLRNSWIDYRI